MATMKSPGIHPTPGSVDLGSRHWMAHAIRQVLTSHGHCAFVAAQTEDTALIK